MAKIRDVFRWGIPSAAVATGLGFGIRHGLNKFAKNAPKDPKMAAKEAKGLLKETKVFRKKDSLFGKPIWRSRLSDDSYPGMDPSFEWLTPEAEAQMGGPEAAAPGLILKQNMIGPHEEATYARSMEEAENQVRIANENAIALQKQLGQRYLGQQELLERLEGQRNSVSSQGHIKSLIRNPYPYSGDPSESNPHFSHFLTNPNAGAAGPTATLAQGGSVPRYANGGRAVPSYANGGGYDLQDFFNNYEGGMLGRRWRYKDLSRMGALLGLPGWRESHEGDYGENWRDIGDQALQAFGLSPQARENITGALSSFGQYLNKDNKITRGMERLQHDIPQWLDQHAERHTASGAALHGAGKYLQQLLGNWIPPGHTDPIYDTRKVDADPVLDPVSYQPAAGEFKGIAETALGAIDRAAGKVKNYFFPGKGAPAPTQISPQTTSEFHIAGPGFDPKSDFYRGENTKAVDYKDIVEGKKNAGGLLNAYTAKLIGGEDMKSSPVVDYSSGKLDLDNPFLLPNNPWGKRIEERLKMTPEETEKYNARLALKNPDPGISVAQGWNDELQRQLTLDKKGNKVKFAPQPTVKAMTRAEAEGEKYPKMPPESKLKFYKGEGDREGTLYPTMRAYDLANQYPNKYKNPLAVPKPKLKDIKGYQAGNEYKYDQKGNGWDEGQTWTVGPKAPPLPYTRGAKDIDPEYNPNYANIVDWMNRQDAQGLTYEQTEKAPEGYDAYKQIKSQLGLGGSGAAVAPNYNDYFERFVKRGDTSKTEAAIKKEGRRLTDLRAKLSEELNKLPVNAGNVNRRGQIQIKMDEAKRDIATLNDIWKEVGATAEDKAHKGLRGYERLEAIQKAKEFERKHNPRTVKFNPGEDPEGRTEMTVFNDLAKPMPRYRITGPNDSGIFQDNGAHFEGKDVVPGALNPFYRQIEGAPDAPLEMPPETLGSVGAILPQPIKGLNSPGDDARFLETIARDAENGSPYKFKDPLKDRSGSYYARLMDEGLNEQLATSRKNAIKNSKGAVSPYIFPDMAAYKMAYGIPAAVQPTPELQEALIKRQQAEIAHAMAQKQKISAKIPEYQEDINKYGAAARSAAANSVAAQKEWADAQALWDKSNADYNAAQKQYNLQLEGYNKYLASKAKADQYRRDEEAYTNKTQQAQDIKSQENEFKTRMEDLNRKWERNERAIAEFEANSGTALPQHHILYQQRDKLKRQGDEIEAAHEGFKQSVGEQYKKLRSEIKAYDEYRTQVANEINPHLGIVDEWERANPGEALNFAAQQKAWDEQQDVFNQTAQVYNQARENFYGPKVGAQPFHMYRRANSALENAQKALAENEKLIASGKANLQSPEYAPFTSVSLRMNGKTGTPLVSETRPYLAPTTPDADVVNSKPRGPLGLRNMGPMTSDIYKTTGIDNPVSGRRIMGSGVPAINQVIANLKRVQPTERNIREAYAYDTVAGAPGQLDPGEANRTYERAPIIQGRGTTLYDTGNTKAWDPETQFPYESRYRPNSNIPADEDRFALDKFWEKREGKRGPLLQQRGQFSDRELQDSAPYSGDAALKLDPMQQWRKAHQAPGDYDPIYPKYQRMPAGTNFDLNPKHVTNDIPLASANARVTTVQPTPSWKSWEQNPEGTSMMGQGTFAPITKPNKLTGHDATPPPAQGANNLGATQSFQQPQGQQSAQVQPQQQQAFDPGQVGAVWGDTVYAYGGRQPRFADGGRIMPGSVVPVHGTRMPSYEYGGYAQQVQQQMLQEQQQQQQMQEQQMMQQQQGQQQQMMQQQMMQQQMMMGGGMQGQGVLTPNGTFDPTGQMQMPQDPQQGQPGMEGQEQEQGGQQGGMPGVPPQIKSRVPYYQQMWQKMAQKAAMPKGAVRNVTGLKRTGK